MNPNTKTEEKEQLDINSLLNSIPIDTSQVITPIVNTGTNTEQYDVNNLLSNIQEYKEPSLKDKSMGGNYQDALRLFAQGGPLGLYANRGFVKGADEFIKPLKDISIEDWKQHSLLAPMLEYGLGSLTDPNSPETIAAKNQLLQKAHSAYEGIKNISGEQIYNLGKEIVTNPFGIAGEAAKGVIYDPEQIPLGGIANKGISKLLETPLEKIKGKYKTLEEEFGIANPKKELTEPVKAEIIKEATAPLKAEVTLEGANYRPELDINKPIETIQPKPIEIISENPVMPAERLNPQTISQKEQILKDVGIENFRNSALEGDYQNASSQYLTSKSSNEAYGKGMAEQILHEKEALNNHFQGVVTDTKGSVPRKGGENEISDRIDIGRNFKSAINDSYESVKTLRNQLYQNVRDTIGETPVNMNETTKLLNTQSQFKVGDKKSLKEAIDTRMEELGMRDKDGTLQPSTVTQAEELRKFINDEVKNNPELYDIAKKIKDSIDNDMFSHVGGESFKVARDKHAELQELFENPDAIRNFRKDVGVNQKIADENVIQKLNTLPESQFTHILKVLKEQGQTSALSDIKANLVNQIKEAGQSEIGEPWNARAAAVQRTKLGNKLKEAFADDLQALEKIDKGIQAGNILHIPTKYPGAAVQTHLLKNKFNEMALQKAATVIGGGAGSFAGPLGGALGAAVGEYGGGKGASALKSNRQLQQLQKDIKSGTPLNELNKNQLKD